MGWHTRMPLSQYRKGDVLKIFLAAIGTAGLVSVALVAPNAVQMIRLFKPGKRRYQSPKYINQLMRRLEKKGWIRIERKGNQLHVRLTPKGRIELSKYQNREKKVSQRKWDGKWRIVIFDIKKKKGNLRNYIRENIKAFGFVKLQQSVWVYPYPCDELIALLKASCHIGKEVLYIISESIENDRWLRQRFRLTTT